MDLPVIVRVGLGIAVADAAEEVRRHAHAVTERPGGGGAVREVAEAILRAQGKWQAIVDSYLKRETDERDLSS
jgi:3-deoxy-D-manno-octulosonate 8-phosphate phosphatase (KDO 8-P phosphatase)